MFYHIQFAFHPPLTQITIPRCGYGIVLLILFLLSGCGTWERIPNSTPLARQSFEIPKKRTTISNVKALQAFQAGLESAGKEYLLGAGDKITVKIAGRPKLSNTHLVGPDGQITLPIAGPVQVSELSRQDAATTIERALLPYYSDIAVTVHVEYYGSNRIIVLGRVENPGVLHFDTQPTLLETLSNAGGLPLLRKEQLLTRCAVIRDENILWLDLKRLLTGDLTLNIRLKRNDVVYIPDASDTPVYVLGAVNKPGVYRLTPQMSFLDALGQAGGPTVDANMKDIHVIRPSEGLNMQFSLETLLKPDRTLNVAMEEGDIIYVPRSNVAKIGYILNQLNPFSTLFMIRQLELSFSNTK